jgi:hypothetical protein
METIEQQYTYKQLLEIGNDQALNNVREWWNKASWDDSYWTDSVKDTAKEDGYALGFVIDGIYWSGFWSQGDGACWVGQVDIQQWLTTHCKDSIGLSAWIALIQEGVIDKHIKVEHRSNHYYHENTMDFGYIEDNTYAFEDDDVMTNPNNIFKGMSVANVFELINASDCAFKTTEEIREAVITNAQDFAKDIYKKLEMEYEYMMSDENLAEMCEINEWMFNLEGEMV